MPDPIPPSAAVELVYRVRSRLIGTVGGDQVDLILGIPSSASEATGSVDQDDVRVAWLLSDNSGGDPDLPALLEGTVGGRPVRVQAVFRLGPGFFFDRASVEGDLGGLHVKATVARAEGGFGSTSTVAGRGTIGESEFTLFGAVNGSHDRGILRGAVNGEVIHVNARVSDGRNVARLSGSFPGTRQLSLLAMGATLFFL